MFGGAVRWSIPTLRLSRWSAGILRHDDDRPVASRYAAMFATLERWIGAPTLQAAMFEVARLPVDRINAANILDTFNAATGQVSRVLFQGVLPEGEQRLAMEVSDLPSGVYILWVETANGWHTRKVTIAR